MEMEKPMLVNLIGMSYIIGGLGLLGFGILLPIANTLVLDVLNLILVDGGFFAGDVFITNISLYHAAYFVLPMIYISGPISMIAGFMLLTTDKKLARYLTIAASIFYCVLLIGLIVNIIMLQEDVRNIYIS